MAIGDAFWFNQKMQDEARAIHQLDGTSVIRCALVTNAITPTALTPDPRWGAGGATDFSTAEVTPGGNYTAGGISLAAFIATLVGSTVQYDTSTDPFWGIDPSNPTDAFWGIVYNDTATGKQCLNWVDLGGLTDMSAGDLTLTWANPMATRVQV